MPAQQTTFLEAKRLVRSSAQKQEFRFLLCRDGKVSAYSGVRLGFSQRYSSVRERTASLGKDRNPLNGSVVRLIARSYTYLSRLVTGVIGVSGGFAILSRVRPL